MKSHLNKVIFLFLVVFIVGCVTETNYLCPDKTVVNDPSSCKLTKTIQPPIAEVKQQTVPEQKETTIPEVNPPQKICPTSCDDGNKCTQDYCDFTTNFQCAHTAIPLCCGDNLCSRADECITCFSDCYTCNDHSCDSKSNICRDSRLYVFTNSEGIKIIVPSDYTTEANWFSNMEIPTLKKIKQIYGFSPATPITYRFAEFDTAKSDPDVVEYFDAQGDYIVYPITGLKRIYRQNQNLSLLEVHEMIHAINFANCKLIAYSSTGGEQLDTKLPLWVDEGLAMTTEIWLPYNYGNEYDKIESRYEPQKNNVISQFEDKSSALYGLINNPNAYGYEHARGSVLLYSWFKYGLIEPQINKFVSSLFNECKIADGKLDNRKIIELWNDAVDRDDTSLFREVGLIN